MAGEGVGCWGFGGHTSSRARTAYHHRMDEKLPDDLDSLLTKLSKATNCAKCSVASQSSNSVAMRSQAFVL